MRPSQTSVVELSVGAGPENPPCPACGEPLFGWAVIRPDAAPVLRCEQCGMAVVGAAAAAGEARKSLRGRMSSGKKIANRNSVQAWLGGSGWAGLDRDSRFSFTPDSARRLGFNADRPGAAIGLMWQTLVNSFTFGHNIGLAALGGAKSTPAEAAWQRAIDWLITVFTAIPLVVIAVLIEVPATVFGRGGSLRVEERPGVEETSRPD